jgi:hypothetical protein
MQFQFSSTEEYRRQRAASTPSESPVRKEIFRLGSTNYDVVSLRLDHYRAARQYDLSLSIANRRQHIDAEDLEEGVVEEIKQPVATSLDA